MSANEAAAGLFQRVLAGLPSDAPWTAGLLFAALALMGLLFLVRGGRWAPLFVALVFAAGGALGGQLAGRGLGLPQWPAILVAAAVAFVAGLVLFRLWLALQVAAAFVGAALALYGTRLAEPLGRFDPRPLLPPGSGASAAAEAASAVVPVPQRLLALWQFLSAEVPSFQLSFYAIVVSVGVAGFVFATLLPKLARAVWAATVGTGLVATAGAGLLHSFLRDAAPEIRPWMPIGLAGVWALALLWNAADLYGLRFRKPAPTPPAEAAA